MENEFLSVRRYVDFQEGNFKTYSIEFLKLYQAICSEIDVIGKAMAVECNPRFKPEDKKIISINGGMKFSIKSHIERIMMTFQEKRFRLNLLRFV